MERPSIEIGYTLLNGSDNGGEVVISQDHITGLFGDFGSRNTHSDTNTGLLEGRSIVDSVSSHTSNLVELGGEHSDEVSLVLGVSPWEDQSTWVSDDQWEGSLLLLLVHLGVLESGEWVGGELGSTLEDTNLEGDGLSGFLDVSGDHDDWNTSLNNED
jgi:hypothetical protein